MLKCFNLSPQNLFQIAKTFYAIKLLPFKTSCFIRSSLRVELVSDNTAGYFPLNFWKKNQNWKLRKKVTSFKSFVWTRTRQFGELRRPFFAEFLNLFPSQSKQLCKFLTTPKKTFFLKFSHWTLQIQFGQSWIFFRWMSKFFFLRNLKEIETDSFFQKKMCFRNLLTPTQRMQYWHPCLKF